MTQQCSVRCFSFYVLFLLHFTVNLFPEVFLLNADDTCDRQRKVLTQSYGIISSGSKEYAMDSHCEWLIRANNSKQYISISFVRMDTECSYDHIYVYDGDSYTSPLLGSFSGNSTPATVVAKTGSMLVLLYSDTNYVRTGFEATFSVTDCPLNCSHRGKCINHHCICDPHQTGIACDIDLCPMNCWEALGLGKCTGKPSSMKCDCKPGYSGADCSLPDDNKNGGNSWHIISSNGLSEKQRASHTGIYIEATDSLYLFGGYTFGITHGDLFTFNFNFNKWENITPSDGPSPRRNHAAVAYGQHFVIFGGELRDGQLCSELWLFNTSSQRWREITSNTSMWPPAVAKHSLTLVEDHWLYVYGGIFENNSFSAQMYRTRLDEDILWEQIIAQGGKRNNRRVVGHSAVYYSSMNTIFVYGGILIEFSHVSKLNHNIFAFHVHRRYWMRLNFPKDKNMPLERAFHTAAIVGDYMVVFGGYTHRHMQEEICYDNQTYLYHLRCHKWIDMTNFTRDLIRSSDHTSYGVFSHVMAVRRGHTILIHGGYSGVMHSTLSAYLLPSAIATRSPVNNPCKNYQTSENCISDLACVWCTHQNFCIERKEKKTCSDFVSGSCPGLCPVLSSCHSCLIWGDTSGVNSISDDRLHDNFPASSCSWLVEDLLCLPVTEAQNFRSANSESNMVAASITSPARWWGPNQTVVLSVRDCASEDFPPGLLSIRYRHPVNWSQPDSVILLRRAFEELYLRSELPHNDSLDSEMNVVKFVAFLHPFYAKPLSERMSRLQLFMCSGGSSLATLRLSNDTYIGHSEIVASHATKSSYICTVVKRPDGTPLFPDTSRGHKYLLDFSVNVSTMVNDTANIQLAWNSFSLQPEAISYQYLEPYKNGSCRSHTNCLACLTDNSCGWCEVDSRCTSKLNLSESVCQRDNNDLHYLITQPNECALCSDYVYCSHCAQVPICEWLVDSAFCVRRGRSKDGVQDPDLCPLPCYRRTSCKSCLGDPGVCAWCETTKSCFLFSTYTTSFMFGLCRDWVDEHRFEPDGNPVGLCHDCTRYKNCKQCLRQLNCGWCSFADDPLRGICTYGEFGKPSEGSCSLQLKEAYNSSSSADGLPQWSYGACPDIDECVLGHHDCHPNATCTNTPDSYECECSVGFKGDGKACTRACTKHCVAGYCSEYPLYKCICQMGWTDEDCSVDCGCHNHSSCSKGPGLCDICNNWTDGKHCEKCVAGSYGSAITSVGCRKCNCNNHGDAIQGYCNATTGACFCKDNTEGRNCSRCKQGYYGDPRNGGHCYSECTPRSVVTEVVSGRLGSSVKSDQVLDCLWLLTVYPVLDMQSLLLAMPNPDAAIELVIEENIQVPCPHNHVYVYDGLPDFIAAGHPNVLLGAFCGTNISESISVIATSGYLTIHFRHSGIGEGFHANYRLLENFFDDNQTCTTQSCLNGSLNLTHNIDFCSNNCSSSDKHGVCDMIYGKCICENGHGGKDCSIKIKPYSLVWSTIYNDGQLLEKNINNPVGRMGHSLFSIPNDSDDIEDLWIFGGYSPMYGEMNDLFVFEALTRKWIQVVTDHRPPARHMHASTSYKDHFYIYGGMDSRKTLGDFWGFNTQKKTWTEIPTHPTLMPRSGSTLTAAENGHLYLIGGLSAKDGFFDKIMLFDMSYREWQYVNCSGAQPIGLYGHSSVFHSDTGSIYIFGGILYGIDNVEVSGNLYAFELETKRWFRLPPDAHVNPVPTRPQPRYFHTAVVTKNYMIILGGRTNSAKHLPKVFGYMFSCNAWVSLTDEDIDVVGEAPYNSIGAAGAVVNGEIYVFGNYDGDLKKLSLPLDLCQLFSSSRVRCILHVGCAFCSVFESGVNQTYCYSQKLSTPSSCYNPKVASEVVPASTTCNSAWIEKRDCGQYGSCTDCVTSWPTFAEAKQVCQWCSNCKVGRCIPVGTSCENENECNIPRKVINSTSMCPTRMCWASDCEKCSRLGECIWTRQVQRSSGFGHMLNRKPVYNWICVTKEIQDSPPFPIKSMPPLQCPLPCESYTNCTACLQSTGGEGGWHQCVWSEVTQMCMTPSFELLRCVDSSCGPVFRGNASRCPVPCWAHDRASYCLSHANCGWCSFSNTPLDGWGLCIEGGIMGPTGGICKDQVLLLGTPLPPQVEKHLSQAKGESKWNYMSCPPEDECANGHHTCKEEHQDCVDTYTSFECHCKLGYELKSDQSGECRPICTQGCINGTCIEPDVCKCHFGYVGKNCSIACKCNGHSDCPSPDELDTCISCQNNTQGDHCQTCKPFFVGNPVHGGKCIPCQVYCHGHSNICLNSDLLVTNSTVVTQPYNKTHVRLSLINNAEMMRQLFESPLMQTILNNPEYMRQMILTHPDIQHIIDKNPEVGHVLKNADIFRETVEMIRNPAMLQEAMRSQEKHTSGFEMNELLEKITEGSWNDAVCIDCQNNTEGKKCDQCIVGYFKAGDTFEAGCRSCECHGHGDTCNPYTGEGCNCQNNTENDRQCTQKNTKNIITPCWQLQCSKCKEYFLGAPSHGHQCYRHMFLDKEYCFDPNTQGECNRQPTPLLEGRTVFFAVQPRYMNVDIRIVVDVTEGGIDFLLSAKEDTFVVDVNKTSGFHYIAIDKKYGADIRYKFNTLYDGSSGNKKFKGGLDDSHPDLSNFTESASSSSTQSTLFMRDADSGDLTTYITVKKCHEFLLIRNLQNRLIITIPQEVYDLRSTRFYMVLRGVGNEKVSSTSGSLFFRQDQTRIDLFVFFSVFFSCFFLFLAICVVVWKVKQAFDVRRARRLHAAEMKHMASRPFGHVVTVIEEESDDYDFLFYSPSTCRKKNKHAKLYGRDSPKSFEERYSIRPIAVEPLSNGSAAVATILVQLPGGAHSLVKMTLASALITSRSSHYHVGCGIRAVMRRRTSHANV